MMVWYNTSGSGKLYDKKLSPKDLQVQGVLIEFQRALDYGAAVKAKAILNANPDLSRELSRVLADHRARTRKTRRKRA